MSLGLYLLRSFLTLKALTAFAKYGTALVALGCTKQLHDARACGRSGFDDGCSVASTTKPLTAKLFMRYLTRVIAAT